MTQHKEKIAVIGSGLSGAVLANKLELSGFKVTVFDKGRGTGGRLSSCRTPSAEADLGAPFFTPASSQFRDWLEQQESIRFWEPLEQFSENSKSEKQNYYVAYPRQSALTRALLSECDLNTSTQVGYVWPEKDQVLIRDNKGNSLGYFDKVIIATPAQQAAKLLEAVPRFSKKAESVTYQSSWVAVVKVKVHKPTQSDIIAGNHPALFRCIKNCSKPGRLETTGQETWVLEANYIWSAKQIDADKEWIAEALCSAFAKHVDISELEVCRVHRWLYSGHQSLDEGYLWDETTNIGACGDWLYNGQLQGAWSSANQLAERLISEINTSTDKERALIY